MAVTAYTLLFAGVLTGLPAITGLVGVLQHGELAADGPGIGLLAGLAAACAGLGLALLAVARRRVGAGGPAADVPDAASSEEAEEE
jgi:hypothetical protein